MSKVRGNSERAAVRFCRVAALASVSSLAALSPAFAQDGTEEEIVVTAERQGRSVRDTMTSVTVIDDEALQARPGLSALSDVVSQLPNTNSFGKSGIAPTVRGVDGTGPALGATAFFAGSRNRLNVQVDGRALSYNEVAYGDAQMWDVSQIEVLRGPQSTMQGRNAIGGTLAIRTSNPTYDFEAAARAIVGSEDLRQGSLSLSGPIIADQLAVRIAVDHREYDSYVEMTSPTVYGEGHPEHYTTQTIRGKILFEPAAWDSFRALLTLTSTDFEGPQVERVRRPFYDHVSALGAGEPVHRPQSLSGVLETSWDLNANLTFESVVSYTDFRFRRFASAAPAEINGRESSFEPRIRFQGDGVRGVVGAYVYEAVQGEQIALVVNNRYHDETQTFALFAEADIDLTERLRLLAGVRGEQETRVRNGAPGNFLTVDLDDTTEVFLPRLGLAYDLSEDTTIGAIVSRGYNGGGAGFTFEPPFVNFEFEPEFVWNYEAYLRTRLAPRATLNGNVFYSEYTDMQVPFDVNPDPALFSQIILNADEVITYGAELSLAWALGDFLSIRGELGFLHTDVSAPGALIDNTELTRAADVTGGFGVAYVNPDGFEASFDAFYSGGYYSDELNDPRAAIDPYWSANAQIAYNLGPARVFVSASNVFDAEHELAILPHPTDPAFDHAFLLSPRRIMGGVTVRF